MSSPVKSDMSEAVDENDSDIEILDQGVLRASFFRQQLRLIYEIDNSKKRIPRAWPAFQRFINEVIDWHPSAELVRSTWRKLSCAEELFNNKNCTDVVEISDEEESPVQISDDSEKNTCETEHENEKQEKVIVKKKKSVDSRNRKRQRAGTSVTLATNPRPPKLAQEIIANILPSKRKRSLGEKAPRTRKAKALKVNTASTSAPMTHDEAEILRQQLLIDKIIELELPKVIQSVLKDNVRLPARVKKSPKSSKPRKKKS